MTVAAPDTRSPERRALDGQIAAERPLAPPDMPPGATPLPVEAHLHRKHRPVAIAGVVQNGMVRFLDPGVKLPEHSRVIVVASEAS